MTAPGPIALRAVVVIPAYDEADTIGSCLLAVASQEGLSAEEFAAVLVVHPGTSDDTRGVAARAVAQTDLRLTVLTGPGGGPGPARRMGMDLAASLLGPRGLIASTDADSVVAPDWLIRQLDAIESGADAVGGYIELDPTGLHPFVAEYRAARAAERLEIVHAHTPHAEHHHFAGASMALTAEAYHRLGGIEPLAALEDEALERALRAHGLRIERPLSVRVRTSARLTGRASAGLAHDLAHATALATARPMV